MADFSNVDLNFAYLLFDGMQKDNLGYIYRGHFDQNITDNILLLTESNLEKEEQSSKVRKRIYSIMVEGLQNITRHQEDSEEASHEYFGIFVIQKKEDKYYITTGNVADNANIDTLKRLLEKINSLEKDALKDYYKEVLEEGSLSNKGGAGLGLIDMARKSGNKLIYDFVDVNEKYSYFYLQTVPTLTEGESLDDSNEALKNIMGIHKVLNEASVRLIFNGLFNQESLLNLLATIKGQITGSESVKNKVFYLIVEMLQNIIKHGTNIVPDSSGNPGLFLIGEKEGHYIITTGNYILNTKIEKLRTKIDCINELNEEELDKYYIKSLFNFEIDDSKESGLGIIDLRIKSGNKLHYTFHEVNNAVSFYTLQTYILIK
ncbi:MAG: hypothetical protein A2275_00510 [Bacteroidetes bacterium RIFOXYA12_FULL_35_11]|nr:MAG: hypothetical protein A2X01_08860 [Bacteroidetes bacterium GWF2_35_48]OFY72980.1 MAG: hypothetical protein A2275_00510 [Bacteroidetes bacterium RIFOXYA12_FULL_35_11]OFY92538.1 MAG: hypothetical protein A2491_12635 [Bacteroidetes bacterium RIFOXYC12_FULL_35_7]HBX51838.1 hypothetical protein [Bacteroidales bacterium]